MKRFKVEQAQKSCKFADNCVDLPTHAVVGGGAIQSLPHKGLEDIVILRVYTRKNPAYY